MLSGASGPISPSSSAPTSAERGKPRVLLRQMTAVDRRADARLDLAGQRLAILLAHRVGLGVDRLGDHRPGELAVAQRPRAEGRDRRRQRRQRTGRGIGGPPHRLDLALGHAFDQRADQFDLAGEIAIDGAGGDARPRRDRRDLDRRHAARGRRVARRIDDGVVAGVEPADHVFGAAVGHDRKTEQ